MELLVIRLLAVFGTEADSYISKYTGEISMEILVIRFLVVLDTEVDTYISKCTG